MVKSILVLCGLFLTLASSAGAQVSAPGQTFPDATFGTNIRRLSNVFPGIGSSLIYSINGLWNADGNLYAHNIDSHGSVNIVNTMTGATIATGVPFNPSGESSFDPINPDIFYYKSGTTLRQYSVFQKTSTLVKTFGGELGNLGGSSDFIDRTGRYFLLRIGHELRIWDKQNDVLYSSSIPVSVYDGSGGWAGLSPDGNFVIVSSGWNHFSYKVDHFARQIDSSGVLFWALCGDHGDVISASDGKTYQVTANCYDSPDAYLVDVSIAKFSGGTMFSGVPKFSEAEIEKQKTGNKKLFTATWNDAMHFSCAATSDWCYVSIQSGDDTSGEIRPYKSEIVRVKTTSPYTVERLARHMSLGVAYTATARVNSSPDGGRAMFTSNFGQGMGQVFGYSDIYALEVSLPFASVFSPASQPAPSVPVASPPQSNGGQFVPVGPMAVSVPLYPAPQPIPIVVLSVNPPATIFGENRSVTLQLQLIELLRQLATLLVQALRSL